MKQHGTQRKYWQSLEHLANTPQIEAAVNDEFFGYDPDGMKSIPEASRRRFLQLAGASMALAGLTLTGCRRWPEEKLAPYTSNPANRSAGIPQDYATVMELNGVAQPLLVKSFDGRPIKIEGNPSHPYSATIPGKQGAATRYAQASVLEMYDPNRSRSVIDHNAEPEHATTMDQFEAMLESVLAGAGQGEKMAVLIESTSSPSTARMKAAVLAKYPKLSWFEYEPLSRDNETAGIKLAIGQSARPVLHLDKAAVVVSFDNDFLGEHPAQVKYASDWASRRRSADEGEMSRVYVFESAFTLTGAMADKRVPCKQSDMIGMLAAFAAALGVGTPGWVPNPGTQGASLQNVVKDVLANGSNAVITIGANLPPEAHELGLLINSKLGALGNTVTLVEDPAGDRPTHIESIVDLAGKLKANTFETIFVIGGNAAYNAPADLDIAHLIQAVPYSIHLGVYYDETAKFCKWHVPRAHYLESWTDARSWDGTPSVGQPLIEPLFGGKTTDEFLALIAGSSEKTGETIVRKTFAGLIGNDSLTDYRKVLHDGFLASAAYKTVTPKFSTSVAMKPLAASTGMEVRFMQSSGMYDGRFAPNGWLQELPDTMTKMVWDNAAILAKADADAASITTGDLVRISIGQMNLEIAAYVMPGQPNGVIGLPLGYGRRVAGPIGTEVGFNTYALRTSAMPYVASGATLVKAGGTYPLTLTQNHYLIDNVGFEGRQERVGYKGENAELIREGTLVELKADKSMFKRKEDGSLSLQLFDPPAPFQVGNEPHAWGMSIDMTACIGCNACIVACQAENNIPIVGKDQADNNRAMHWIRIDRYFKGDKDNPENDPNPDVIFQPMMCQHCENAPCEQVCPVGATMHDTEGLNVMVYNRCIGTRYCSNNCPYKVRRFNYLDWHSQDPRNDKYPMPFLGIPDQQQLKQVDEIKRMVFNPDVTVRMRGVMEKCTYCVQRIHTVTQAKKAANEDVKDGDIITACQQTCPTQAIVFGNLKDPESKVSKLHKAQRSYAVLADLDTRPRTLYQGRVRNPGEATA